jgi:enoyl-CoA hydratase/carnithine racemase
MGHQRAAEALLLGDPFSAETALEVGLINRIVPPAEVHALAHRQAQRLAAKPMGALVASKRLMKQEQAAPVAARIDEEIAIFGRMLGEPAAREALTAFMENRRPDFSGL